MINASDEQLSTVDLAQRYLKFKRHTDRELRKFFRRQPPAEVADREAGMLLRTSVVDRLRNLKHPYGPDRSSKLMSWYLSAAVAICGVTTSLAAATIFGVSPSSFGGTPVSISGARQVGQSLLVLAPIAAGVVWAGHVISPTVKFRLEQFRLKRWEKKCRRLLELSLDEPSHSITRATDRAFGPTLGNWLDRTASLGQLLAQRLGLSDVGDLRVSGAARERIAAAAQDEIYQVTKADVEALPSPEVEAKAERFMLRPLLDFDMRGSFTQPDPEIPRRKPSPRPEPKPPSGPGSGLTLS